MSAAEILPVAPQKDRVLLRFEPTGDNGTPAKEARVPAGTTLFDAASWNGIAIDSTCGGHGTCKKCKVRVVEGKVPLSPVDPRAFSIEELKAGWRLACRAPAEEDLVVEVPPLSSRPKAALVGVGRHVILRPAVQKRYLELEEPTLEDQASDLERVLAAMDDVELRVPLEVMRTLGGTLRAADFKVTAVLCDDLLLDVEPGDTTGRTFAIAFDLGTTTVVANLLDLETGSPLAVQSQLNKQQPFGADVISRVSATMLDPDALGAPAEPRARDARRARAGGVRGGRRAAGRGLRDRGHRQPDDDPDRARDRPRAALDGAVHDGRGARCRPRPRPTSASACTSARRPCSSPRWAPTSAATSSPACSRRASRSTGGSGSSSTSARTARSRSAPRRGRSRRPRPPARPSKPRRSAAACAPPTARSRA